MESHLKREKWDHRGSRLCSLSDRQQRPTLQQVPGDAFKITKSRGPLIVPWVFNRNNRGGSLGVQGVGHAGLTHSLLLFLGSDACIRPSDHQHRVTTCSSN